MCDIAKEREKYVRLDDEKNFWSPPHLGIENLEKPPFLIDLYQYFIIIWDISLRKPPSCVCSSVNDNHLVCDKLCWVGDLGVTSVCIFGEMVRTRFGKSEPARFGYPNQVRNMSDVERYITLGVSKRCLNDHRLVCDKSWGGGWPWCAFLEEWFGPSPNLQVRISELRFGNPNLQVRNPNLSFGSGIVEYDVKIFNHLLIWVTDDNLNVF